LLSHYREPGSSEIHYYGCSFFDNEFFSIKRRLIKEYNEDVSNQEQQLLMSLSHPVVASYVMSFYLSKSIYIFTTAGYTTLDL